MQTKTATFISSLLTTFVTLKLYLYYLRSSMLIAIADVYTRAKKAVEKREKKLFFCEEGLRRALTFDMDESKSAENVVAWHLIKRGYRRKVFFDAYYWKNKHDIPAASVEKEKISVNQCLK
ncbi:hypothetical protein C4E22_05030 [ANME-1 cluster archaeon AG-394-G06]|nr:hypothetical protein [ANME-1 cluster archaeon AG-394-G06]